MTPRIHNHNIDPPYPWRPIRSTVYAPRAEGNTITLAQMPPISGHTGAPRFTSRLLRVVDGMAVIEVLGNQGDGNHMIAQTYYLLWDGSTWRRRRRNHRDVRMRLERELQHG